MDAPDVTALQGELGVGNDNAAADLVVLLYSARNCTVWRLAICGGSGLITPCNHRPGARGVSSTSRSKIKEKFAGKTGRSSWAWRRN